MPVPLEQEHSSRHGRCRGGRLMTWCQFQQPGAGGDEEGGRPSHTHAQYLPRKMSSCAALRTWMAHMA